MTFAQPFTDSEILDRVGAGAMGTVFKARHKKLNRIVALKVLKPSLARDGRYVDRLRREARIVASLNDPHIVTGYDLGEEGGYHFFVMEFVEGKSLRALLVEWGIFAEEYVLKVGQQVAQALDHAYQRGVIHRDIKPGNILIDEHGSVKLTDMGLAKGPADMTLTRDGATVGTPQYISPEQARNPQDVDVRSDLYSLGATLYHMATGVPPFRGDTMAELITKVLHDVPVPPNELNPALSEGLSLVLRKLLAKDLRVRYQTPGELLQDIDRVQRSLPPEVDPARLAAVEERRSSLLLSSLAVLAVAGLLGGAVWIGMQFRGDPAQPPTVESFFVDLDGKLRECTTPGQRLMALRAMSASVPLGAGRDLQVRERSVLAELQVAVDTTVASFQDDGWQKLVEWLRDPLVWPDAQTVANQRLLPRLRESTGISFDALREVARIERFEALNKSVEREVRDRDAELLRRLDEYLVGALPAQVEERLRVSDFAGADRLWADSLTNFTRFARVPLVERLAEPTLQKARERCEAARKPAQAIVDAAEHVVAEALRAEAETVLSHLQQQLAAGIEPDLVDAAQKQLRQELLLTWPSSSRFRVGMRRDPWPEIERRSGELQHAIGLARAAAAARRFDARCDLAWRTLCHGNPADALAVLPGQPTPGAAYAALQNQHLRALQAAVAVHDAVLTAIARSPAPVPAFPRAGSTYAVALRVEGDGGERRLWSQELGREPRRVVLSEFRFSELLAHLRGAGGDPLAGLAREDANLGTLILSMVGDELAGLGSRLAQLEDGFVVDQVWPRILRVRGEREEVTYDRAEMFRRVVTEHQAAMQTWDLRKLEGAIQVCDLRIKNPDQLSDRERQELRAAKNWLRLAQRRENVLDDVRRGAPRGAQVEVDIDGGEIRAAVVVPAVALFAGAHQGWLLHGDQLEFAGGDQPWSELPQLLLQGPSGIEATAQHTTLQLDCVLPPVTVGQRLYVVEFRGVAVLVCVAGNDAVYAALLEGDPQREEVAQRAFKRAMEGGFQAPVAIAIPGAVHRLTIDIQASPSRTRAQVRVLLEGVELLDARCDLDPQKAAGMRLFPRQEIAVQRMTVRGTGL
ncbi:MAG: serine/threonine protein kinase [Planctomycetes bacterium]|nr:serine/threonine protein kinase [Planctomycetota bacterium]